MIEGLTPDHETVGLRFVMRQLLMTNTSLRERFGIAEKSAATASRLLAEALEAGVILVRDLETGNRNRTYLPYWTGPTVPRK
jgi:ATP-dependent DNA helicase RecG